MKVHRNSPSFVIVPNNESGSCIPVRLEIASRLIAGRAFLFNDTISRDGYIRSALEFADLLIQAHNETCEEAE